MRKPKQVNNGSLTYAQYSGGQEAIYMLGLAEPGSSIPMSVLARADELVMQRRSQIVNVVSDYEHSSTGFDEASDDLRRIEADFEKQLQFIAGGALRNE